MMIGLKSKLPLQVRSMRKTKSKSTVVLRPTKNCHNFLKLKKTAQKRKHTKTLQRTLSEDSIIFMGVVPNIIPIIDLTKSDSDLLSEDLQSLTSDGNNSNDSEATLTAACDLLEQIDCFRKFCYVDRPADGRNPSESIETVTSGSKEGTISSIVSNGTHSHCSKYSVLNSLDREMITEIFSNQSYAKSKASSGLSSPPAKRVHFDEQSEENKLVDELGAITIRSQLKLANKLGATSIEPEFNLEDMNMNAADQTNNVDL